MARFSKRKKSIHSKNKQKIDKVAKESINHLFQEAEKNFQEHPERSHRYAELASRIWLKYKISLQPEVKRRLCRKCRKFMVPGKTCKIRIHQSRVIYTCTLCGNIQRFPLKQKNKSEAIK